MSQEQTWPLFFRTRGLCWQYSPKTEWGTPFFLRYPFRWNSL